MVLLLVTCAIVCRQPAANFPVRSVNFQKTVLDREFRSEGVAVADVNRDRKMDVIAGNLWYEAPAWTPREIAPVKTFDAAKGYSNSFVNFAADINGDGWPDQILIDTPGIPPVLWRENPQGKAIHWTEHRIVQNACNESPAFASLTGTGKNPVLVLAVDDQQMVWVESDARRNTNPTFITREISEKFTSDKAKNGGVYRYSHGLGVGDISGDGRPDVVIRSGYWEAPNDSRAGPWRFVPASLGAECAQMAVYDINGDGLNDVVSSSAHNIGVWWHEQKKGDAGSRDFVQHQIDSSFSQSHSLILEDINGDGLKDIVTGKRFWAHGPSGDVNPNDPAVLYWFELNRDRGAVKWVKHTIDNDSGVGTQFTVADINGDKLPDVVTSNKKGVFVFLQRR
jgi:FG-GAP-like repeat